VINCLDNNKEDARCNADVDDDDNVVVVVVRCAWGGGGGGVDHKRDDEDDGTGNDVNVVRYKYVKN
jgi:hypothetical protein